MVLIGCYTEIMYCHCHCLLKCFLLAFVLKKSWKYVALRAAKSLLSVKALRGATATACNSVGISGQTWQMMMRGNMKPKKHGETRYTRLQVVATTATNFNSNSNKFTEVQPRIPIKSGVTIAMMTRMPCMHVVALRADLAHRMGRFWLFYRESPGSPYW